MKPEDLKQAMRDRLRGIFNEVAQSERAQAMNPLERHGEIGRRLLTEVQHHAQDLLFALSRESGVQRYLETRPPEPILVDGVTYEYRGPTWDEMLANDERETGK